MQMYTVNQLSFAATLFRCYFISPFSCDKLVLAELLFDEPFSLIYGTTCNIWFATGKFRDDEILAKFSHRRIKVGLQYVNKTTFKKEIFKI
jgi:hypothetical protein